MPLTMLVDHFSSADIVRIFVYYKAQIMLLVQLLSSKTCGQPDSS